MNIEQPPASRSFLSRLRTILYWVLPVAILAVILTKIDFVLLYETLRRVDPLLYGLGVAFFPMTLLFNAVRWKVLIVQYLGVSERLGYLLKQYCIGLSISIFLPGQIGMDVYRVAVAGRRFGRYTSNIAVVLEEKILSLVACIGIVLGVTPWLDVKRDGHVLEGITDVASAILAGSVVALLICLLAARLAIGKKIAALLTYRLQRIIMSMRRRLGVEKSSVNSMPRIVEIFRPFFRPRQLAPVVLLSAANLIALAVANQLFLSALDVEVPFTVSLFVVAVLFFVVAIPISFAGLGVREAAFILLLGMFGISPETALVINFSALSGVLLNYSIGGVSIYMSGKEGLEWAPKSR